MGSEADSDLAPKDQEYVCAISEEKVAYPIIL